MCHLPYPINNTHSTSLNRKTYNEFNESHLRKFKIMKTIIALFTFVTISIGLTAQNGYCFTTSTRGSFENMKAAKFDKIKLDTEQTNIYTFSFSDKYLVHHIVRETGTICQFYKITDINDLGSNSYLITVVSGTSGSEYFYYLTVVGDDISFYQIDSIGGNDKMSGTKFGGFGSIDLVTYSQD